MATKAIVPTDFVTLQAVNWFSNQIPQLESVAGKQIKSMQLVMERDAKYAGGIGYGVEIVYAEPVETESEEQQPQTIEAPTA